MSLSPIQRELVETLLGVKPRRKGLHFASSEEKQDKKIGSALDDYERREGKVLEAIKELEAVPATGQIVVDLQQRVSLIRRSLLNTGRDVAPKVIEQGYDDLEAIKEEARAAGKLANANKEFYSRLEAADRDLHALENHEQHGFIANQISTVESTLQQARDAAKGGDFGTANTRLGTAIDASRAAKERVDQYDRDLKAFNIKAGETAATLTALDKHPKKDAGSAEIGDGNTKLGSARTEAVAGRFPAANLLLGQANQAHIDAKAKADTAFIADIDAAALDLDTVRNNSDPAMVKAMLPAVGPIDTILQTARGQVAAEIDKADASLKKALQEIIVAKGIRDKAAIDLKQVRDDATAADAKLKALENHPQKLHAKTEIDTATQQLSQVRTDAEEGRIDIAMLLQEQVNDNCTKGRDCADKYAAFLVVYANATKICNGAKKIYSTSPTLSTALIALTAAKDKANTERKYVEATTDVNNAMLPVQAKQSGQYKTDSTSKYTTDISALTGKLATLVPAKKGKPRTEVAASALDNIDPPSEAVTAISPEEINALKATPAPEAVIAKILEKINLLKDQIEADAEAGRFDEVKANQTLIHKMITSAKKLAARREIYNVQREQTLTAIKGLDTHKSLLGHMMSLHALVARADKLATTKDMRFEDACKELAEIRKTCELLKDVGKAADTYLKERSEADTALEELEKLKVA
jgi:hypothetical protein